MFVGSCLEEYVVALLAFVAGDGVGKDDFIGVAEEAGITPKEFVDNVSGEIKRIWDSVKKDSHGVQYIPS